MVKGDYSDREGDLSGGGVLAADPVRLQWRSGRRVKGISGAPSYTTPRPCSILAAVTPGRRWLLLGCLLLGALAVRGYRVDLPGLTSDEAFSWRITQYSVGEMVTRLATDVHPPLYFLLLKGWMRLAGDSITSLRGLSILFGVSAVLVAAWLGRVVLDWMPAARGAAALHVVPALLAALHAGQVAAARNVRMYSLGVVLAGATAVALARALGVSSRFTRAWLAYGALAAAFTSTHYYALFTVASQGAFVLGLAVVRFRQGRRDEGRRLAVGLLSAGLVALVLLSPWLRAFVAQTEGVRSSYWISPVTVAGLDRALVSSLTGLPEPHALGRILALLLLATAVHTVRRMPLAGIFLATQALGPWILSVGLSVFGGRPIFLERYLVFAQLPLLVLLGLVAAPPLSRGSRLLAWVPPVVLAASLVQAVALFPKAPSAAQQAAAFLVERIQPGDLVLTESPRALNRLRYWMKQAGGRPDNDVRCLLSRTAREGDRFSHVASIEVRDLVWDDELAGIGARRLWQARDSQYPPVPVPDWSRTAFRAFAGGDGSHYTLVRSVRERDD